MSILNQTNQLTMKEWLKRSFIQWCEHNPENPWPVVVNGEELLAYEVHADFILGKEAIYKPIVVIPFAAINRLELM